MAEARRFAADTIGPRGPCCRAVSSLRGAKLLAHQATALPVRDCTMPAECRCRFQKYPDRREEAPDRRFHYGNDRAAWYVGAQRGRWNGRRAAD
jgi:hypothetical protein